MNDRYHDLDYEDDSDISPTLPGVKKRHVLMVAGALLVLVGVILVITLVVNNHESDLESKYSATVQQIISLSMKENEGYDRLALLCNMFGHRITGSSGLEKATTHVYESMIEDGFSNVQYDDVLVSDWRRGDSSLQMTAPYVKKMNVLALGYSVPTDGILEAGVIVVGSFDELKEKSDLGLVEGRIVVYNVPFLSSYGGIVSYRTQGAAQAAKYGAVASLTRSITPYSLDTPHTGVQYYEDNQTAIPAAAITVEDAQLLQYLQDAEDDLPITLQLMLTCETFPDAPGRNVMGELMGSDPDTDEILVVGGHIDSWDVGTGAHDDAGGVYQMYAAVRLLQKNNLIPRRTIRVVGWTAEENGQAGARAYFSQHIEDLEKTVFCAESDGGTFTPAKWSFSGTPDALTMLQEISDLMKPTINMPVVKGGAGADVAPLTNVGVPGAGLVVEAYDDCGNLVPSKYFYYHHTEADTMDKISLYDFQQCVGAAASVLYVLADMEGTLPTEPDIPDRLFSF